MSGAPRRRVPFTKLQAAGNAYLVVDGRSPDLAGIEWPALARAITDPHFGVGSDGIAVVAPSQVAPVRMRIFNSDGSEAEMSGNGVRLFAKFVLERGIARASGGVLRIETGGGVRDLWPRMRGAVMQAARVGMGVPVVPSGVLARPVELLAAGRRLRLHFVSIGNPHAVWITDEPVADIPLEDVGPVVQNHPVFEQRVNFEVVNVLARDRLRARIFERGEGETMASGTGSTASVIAAHRLGAVGPQVRVALRGGVLDVAWQGEGTEAFLEGPAEEVFEGVFSWEASADGRASDDAGLETAPVRAGGAEH